MNKKIQKFTKFFVVAIMLMLEIANSRLNVNEESVKRKVRKKTKAGFIELLKMEKKLSLLSKIEEGPLRKIICSLDECRKIYPPNKNEQYLNEMITDLVYRSEAIAKNKAVDSIPGLESADV